MGEFNKSYRIRTEVGKDTQLHVKLEQKYDVLEIMSLKIDQENAYRLHTSNYGVIAGRVLANGSFGIPNAKISVFIKNEGDIINDTVKTALYPYNTTSSKDKNGVRYNLLPNEQVSDCHTVIGTFPEKQYALDNDSVLEIFEHYYKYTTRTNEAGDYMIFGAPVGSQTIHVDIDLSDIGILSQKPRDMVYKGYDINQFENPNKFKYDTNLNSLTQVISQDNVVDVIPFWGDETESTIGISRCDIDIQYKFEPTCVFMGSVVSDTASNGISKRCIPSPGMGAMDEITTGSGTIEMIRKKPDGSVEEFQIMGTQLINGDGVWCYQIPMNLDYMMTDEFGNMVPTNDPEKGIPTRTRVRFRVSMQDFDSDSVNMFRCKMLVPHNPSNDDEIDYQFGTNTQENSYRDLFWNGVYTVKSYIPRLQKGKNWRNEKFTGFKRVNYYNDKNPIPYNNIRIRIPFMYTIMCTLVKFFFKLSGWVNKFIRFLLLITNDKRNGIVYTVLDGTICDENLERVCIIPGIDTWSDRDKDKSIFTGLFGRTMVNFINEIDGINNDFGSPDGNKNTKDSKSIDVRNNDTTLKYFDGDNDTPTAFVAKKVYGSKDGVGFKNITVTNDTTYLIHCIEMKLAEEYKVIQFDFYNDWINGLIYIPRWMRNVTKKRTFFWGKVSIGGKVKACNENKTFRKNQKRNIVQQCGLTYNLTSNNVVTTEGCKTKSDNLRCHKSKEVRLTYPVFKNGGIVKSIQNMKQQYLYYFKPCEITDKKLVRMYSTDIVLLGTLNNCDKWGLPNILKEMTSSSFQLPPNLALTDSDIEGREYDALYEGASGYSRNLQVASDLWGSTSKDGEELEYLEHKGVHHDPNGNVGNKGIYINDENGNYTEIAGIDWGYAGPLQLSGKVGSKDVTENKLYKPGGHFLGISCRNSETTIKSCVNLARICEYGVWMSQRHELNVPSETYTDEYDAFKNYATVPSGLISKDEISDTDFRTVFAILNSNKLRTVIDKNTGYPIYDFIYNKPTNFGGELSTQVINDNSYNRLAASSLTETYYEYVDDDYFRREKNPETVNTDEKQIVRTGEYMDKEYLKFRFGLTEDDFTDSKRKEKFLIVSGNNVAFPMFENSYYFYFGLKDGATALDEFKKNYYAVCEKNVNLVQEDVTISLGDIEVVYDGICPDDPQGEITFTVKASDIVYENGLRVELVETGKGEKINSRNDKIHFKNLATGVYTVHIKSEDGTYNLKQKIEVGQVNISADVYAENFTKDVSQLSNTDIFNLDRTTNGGYIAIRENKFIYDKGAIVANIEDEESMDVDGDFISDNLFTSKYIKQIYITDEEGHIIVRNDSNNLLQFEDGSQTHMITTNERGDYMIPVPYASGTYYVYAKTYTGTRCKPVNNAIIKTRDYSWYLGKVSVNNGSSLALTYNTVPYNNILSQSNWWKSEGEANWQFEDNTVQWKLKEALYKNDVSKPHKVSITYVGGIAPYTEVIGGMKEDLVTVTGLTHSDFENVVFPTLNFVSSDGRTRNHFTYQVTDSKKNTFPETPFVFPVIYKPFFMEMGIWYFGDVKKYYTIGSVYNGRTWDYSTEGFNDVKINNVPVANFSTIRQNDTTMVLDEPTLTNDKGGYNYTGPYFKYNGRKVWVTREIEPVVYGLHNNGILNTFKMQVGSSHINNGIEYTDSTSVLQDGLEFFDFTVLGKAHNGKYYVKIHPIVKTNSGKYRSTLVLNDKDNGYTYPLLGSIPIVTNKLHRALIDNTLTNYTGITIHQIDTEVGYIDVSDSSNTGSVYYIVRPEDDIEPISTTSVENKIKSISVSTLINLSSLSHFYPFYITASATDVLNANGKYKTVLKITPNADSVTNFKNKKIVITFYEKVSNVEVIQQSFTVVTNSSSTSVEIDITPYRGILGLPDNYTSVYKTFYFDVYEGNEKAPTSYLYNIKGSEYMADFLFEDKTPVEPKDPDETDETDETEEPPLTE